MMMKIYRRLINLERRLAAIEASSSGVIDKPNSGGGGGHDYDYLFAGATKVIPSEKTSNFLYILFSGSGASWVEAMPETQPADGVVIDVTKNRIYIHGAFGGG
jgi:hypothetical protein